MECLNVPLDHRLRRRIRGARPINATMDDAKHVQILYDFGTHLRSNDGNSLPICELAFGMEMARPELKGGVVVALLQPHSTQEYSEGFVTGRDGCETLNAVAELISAVNGRRLGFDDTSVFDAIPFLDETMSQHITKDAQNTFAKMIRAKQPDVVICCYKTETENQLVRDLCHEGIGRSFVIPTLEYDPSLCLLRISAFHPSYAINRYPTYSCLRRLLILEFTKAFALWRGKWKEEPWMDALRDICRREASRVFREANVSELRHVPHLQQRWKTILDSLGVGFAECRFFHRPSFNTAKFMQDQLTKTNITWLCCDAACFLDILHNVRDESCSLEVSKRLLDAFRGWCSETWQDGSLKRNKDIPNGYFDHLPLVLKKSEQPTALAKKLENRFYDLLRDLNMSYSFTKERRLEGSPEAQRNAFRRFAGAIEDILEEALESNICTTMDSLSLG